MGAPESGIAAAQQPTADTLLTAFRTIKDPERAKHVAVLDYWLSIRGDKEFPPLHDLDPLEISDAAPHSILFELLSGGQDAEIRHLGDELKADVTVQRIIDASNPSLLSSIARKLPIVAISRDFLSFEDNFTNADGLTRCWVTLLPLSSCGSWVDYVYAFISLEKGSTKGAKPAPKAEEPPVVEPELVTEEVQGVAEEAPAVDVAETVEAVADEPEPVAELPAEDQAPAVEEPVAEVPADEPEALVEVPVDEECLEEPAAEEPEVAMEELPQPVAEPEPVEAVAEPEPEPEPEAALVEDEPPAKGSPGFSGILEGLASLAGFYGQGVKVTDPVVEVDMHEPLPAEPETVALEPLELEETAAGPEAAPEPEPEPATAEPVAFTAEQPIDLVSPAPAALEGSLQNKLDEVRAKADEARQAALRATAALHEGLSAAYDFALDAETSPEEYLRLVEAQGLKIQLRAPMAPVGKLAFNGLVDEATLGQCEKILAWALKEELARGELLGRIDQAGGISELAGEVAKAA